MPQPNELELLSLLKNNICQIPNRKSKSHLYFLIGNDSSGKTKLLNQTQLSQIQTISSDQSEINTWYDGDSIYLELPPVFFSSSSLMQNTIKQLKRLRVKHLNGLIVCINIYDAIQQKPKDFVIFLKKTASHISKLCYQYKQKPRLHLAFTHMDKIAGFCHTFKKPDQPWGYNFKSYVNHASLLRQNSNLYQDLLKTLHQQLLEKIHFNDDKLSRYLIREFPLQMESMGNLVNACVNHLAVENVIFSDIFFTSSKQDNSALDRLTTNISDTYNLRLNNTVPQSSLDKHYFIEGMLKQITKYHEKKSRNIKPSKYFKLASTTALAVLIGIGSLHIINHNKIKQTNKSLLFYKQSTKESFNDLINALDHLDSAFQSIHSAHGLLPFTNLNSFSTKVTNEYHTSLNNKFLPLLAGQIVSVMQQARKPAEIYYALKAYLMLGQPEYINEEYLIQWLEQHTPSESKIIHSKLRKLLNHALAKPYQGIALDQASIASARNYLLALPKNFLYYKLIEDKFPKTYSSLKVVGFNYPMIQTPYQFIKDNFFEIYQNQMASFAKEFKNDQYVLDENQSNILKTLRESYLNQYHRFWKKIITQLKPNTFQNYHQGAELFYQLSTKKSGLEAVYNLIHVNTSSFRNAKSGAQRHFNQNIAKEFTTLNLVTISQLQSLRPNFKEVARYFETINQSTNQQQVAFDISKQRFNNSKTDPITQIFQLEEQLPYPINAWVKGIATNAWFIILQDTQQYINQKWQSIVYSFYQRTIKGKFPFSENQNGEVSRKAFISFFNHDGKLNHFFRQYLLPFIDISSPQWKTKSKDELKLPIHKNTIKELIRANVIREMFFTDSSSVPNVKFTLHALALDPIIANMKININGQKLTETQDQKQSHEFSWPSSSHHYLTQLTINNISGEHFQVSEDGYWSLFKLLRKSNLKPYGNDMTNYQLIFDVNGSASKFLMVVNKGLNPFVPGILEHFELPESIS